ncbi:hypothetical protein [Arthrobacter sp. Y-9]|uniref:hypothetical protein n=1 Tax=Arthrobacter sp. Y-9 TaxID=3039385 RepID=UPI00241DA690|nr:hypothetical protein [Arthrobacter sp. Y-9]WFR83566.1 hypothetical protein P9849_13530 [Arthrobacter sp. Y-9]
MPTKKMILGAAAGLLALGAATGVASAAFADTSASGTPASPSTAQNTPAVGDRHGGGKLVQELASKLGVDQSKVEAALKSFRDANRPSSGAKENSESKADRQANRTAHQAALEKSLASALGVSEAKVHEAFTAIHADQRAQREASLKKKLDSAVTSGKLTQAEEDAVLKAQGLGLLGGGRRE